jgi:hypothetical protein
VAGLLSRIERVGIAWNQEHYSGALKPLPAETRKAIHEAKLNLIKLKRSPSDDPQWGDDTPPPEERIDFRDWYNTLDDRDPLKAKAARVYPHLTEPQRQQGESKKEFRRRVAAQTERADIENMVDEHAKALRRGGWT